MTIKEQYRPSEVLIPIETPHNPSLYLINTRTFLDDLSRKEGKPMRMKDVPDSVWKELSEQYDSIWFMGIYEESTMGRMNALHYKHEYIGVLQDLTDEDVVSSPFSIRAYRPDAKVAADWDEWDIVYRKIHNTFGMKVYLDFIPNHVALDHPWVEDHIDYFIPYSSSVDQTPDNFYKVIRPDGHIVYIAHGKDPYQKAWFDSLQLNYENQALQQAMRDELLSLVPHCDGVRCDMAMLLRDKTFYQTWGWVINNPWPGEFWKNTIPAVREKAEVEGKTFDFLAEVYWDENELAEEGFNMLYQKTLYDTLREFREGKASVRDIKQKLYEIMGSPYTNILFIENHDEERAKNVFGRDFSRAAMAAIGFIPNKVLMIHQGQRDGRLKKMPMQVHRLPEEEQDIELQQFYDGFLRLQRDPIIRKGAYTMIDALPLEDGNISNKNLITHYFSYEQQATMITANMSLDVVEAFLPVPLNAKDVVVTRLTDWKTLSGRDVAMVIPQGLYIKLNPLEPQLIRYSLT